MSTASTAKPLGSGPHDRAALGRGKTTSQAAGSSQASDQLIAARIAEAQKALWRAELSRNLLILVTGCMLAALLWAVIDQWIWSPGRAARTLLLAMFMSGAAAWIYRRVVPLFKKRIRPEYAAYSLEHDLPDLRHSLTSYVSLRDDFDREGVRGMVVRSIGLRAAGQLQSHQLEIPSEAAVNLRWWIGVAVTLAAVVGYALFSPKNTLQSAQRLLMPLANIEAPTRVVIDEVLPGDAIVLAGRPLEVTAKIRGLAGADQATIQFGDDFRDSSLLKFNSETGRYVASVTTDRPTSYRVVAADATAGPFKITTRDVPVATIGQVTVKPPAYTRLPEKISSGGAIVGEENSVATIHITTNRRVERGMLELNPRAVGDKVRATGGVRDLDVAVDGRSLTATLPLRIPDAASGAPVLESYRIRVMDIDGNENPEPIVYPIRIVADLAPEIAWVTPTQATVDVPVNSVLESECDALDPDYGLTRVDVEVRKGADVIKRETAWSSELGVRGRQRATWALRPQTLGLRVGDTIQLRMIAMDNRHDLAGKAAPHSVATDAVDVRIIAADENARLPRFDDKEQAKQDEASKGSSSESNEGAENNKSMSPSGDSGGAGGQSGGGKSKEPQAGGQSGEGGADGEGDSSSETQESAGGSGGKSSSKSDASRGDKGANSGASRGSQGSNDAGSETQRTESNPSDADDSGNTEPSGNGQASNNRPSGKSPTAGEPSSKLGESSNGSGATGTDQTGSQGSRDAQNMDAKGGENGQDGMSRGGEQTGSNDQADGRSNQTRADGAAQNSSAQNGSSTSGASDSGSSDGASKAENSAGDNQSEPTPAKAQHDGDAFERIRDFMEQQKQKNAGAGSSGDSTNEASSGSQKIDANQNAESPQKQNDAPKSDGSGDPSVASSGKTAGENGQPGSSGQQDSGTSDTQADSKQNGSPDQSRGNPSNNDSTNQDAAGGMGEDDASSSNQQPSDGKSGNSSSESQANGAVGSGNESESGENGNPSDGSSNEKAGAEGASADKPGNSADNDKGGDGQNKTGGSSDKPNAGKSEAGKSEAEKPQTGQEPSSTDGADADRSGETGSQNNSGNPSSAASSSGKPGESSSGGQSSGQQGALNPGDGEPKDVPPPPSPVDLEYAKKATDMVLEYLNSTRETPDPKLLERLDWTPEELRQFTDRWNQLKGQPTSGADAKQVEDTLRSLGMRSQVDGNIGRTTDRDDRMRGLRDSGVRKPAPPVHRDVFDAFRRTVNRDQP